MNNVEERPDVRVRYYVFRGDNKEERHELNDDASLIAFLDEDNKIEGEFFTSGYDGIKVKYNTHTAHVNTVSTITSHVNVTLFYPDKPFHIFIAPLIDVIHLRNKRDFLLELSKLNVTSISSIIKDHHLDGDGHFTRKFTLNEIEGTLLRIQHLANRMQFSSLNKPSSQSGIFEILSREEIMDIKTKAQSEKIIEMLKESLYQIPKKQPLLKR